MQRSGSVFFTPYLAHTIEYNTSAEPTKLTIPYGAYFRYTYATAAFSNGTVERREVQNRYVNDKATGQAPVEKLYAFSHAGNDYALAGRTQTTLDDPAGNRKKWLFYQGQSLAWLNGLQYQQEVYQGPAYNLLRIFATEWTQDDIYLSYQKNPRPRVQKTVIDDGQIMRREQDVDANGNVIQVRDYPYTPWGQPEATTPTRTFTMSYLSTSPYTSRYILNRQTAVNLYTGAAGGTPPPSPMLTGSVTYDTGLLNNVSPVLMHDTANYGPNAAVDNDHLRRAGPHEDRAGAGQQHDDGQLLWQPERDH